MTSRWVGSHRNTFLLWLASPELQLYVRHWELSIWPMHPLPWYKRIHWEEL